MQLAGRPRHRRDSAARRDRSGALLPRLGHGSDHRGGAGGDPGRLHLRRRRLRADHRAASGSRGSRAGVTAAPAAAASGRTRQRRRAAASSIRVSAEKLDQLVNLVGELVTVQARLSEVAARRDDADILAISEEVDRLTAELRENSMSIRMLPLEDHLRAVPPAGSRSGNRAAQRGRADHRRRRHGAGQDRDRPVERSAGPSDPQQHGSRHRDAGSAPRGRQTAHRQPFTSRRVHSGANVLIRVSDDGRGLDVEAVRARAIEQGLDRRRGAALRGGDLLADPGARVSPRRGRSPMFPGAAWAWTWSAAAWKLCAAPSRSRSKPGAGLTVTLRLPLTLAIIDGLLVRVGQRAFRAAAGQQPGMRRADPAGHPGRARQSHRQRARRD